MKIKSLNLPPDSLSPNPLRPRMAISSKSILELADSIRRYGILNPILVGKTPVGYQIIAGERRWRAGKMAGLRELPCLVYEEISQKEMAILSLVENIQREDLNLFEQAALILKMQNEFKLDLLEIGERVGFSISEIEEWLNLLELPEKIKNTYLKGKLGRFELLRLARLENPLLMMEEFNRLSALEG